MEDNTMPQLVEPTTLDAQREIIRRFLSEIANDIGMALRDAGLSFPVFMTVRDNGDSLATIATPLDPSDDNWSRAAAIVCDILEKRIDGGKLTSRELACAITNGSISAAEVGPG
jgi:hypothetical protein